MPEIEGRLGILYPARLPSFRRALAPPPLQHRVRWFWIPRWHLAPGRTSRQRVLPFAASNLVIEPSGISLAGPTTGVSQRELDGSGWAVGALLRPAGIASLQDDPAEIRDREIPFDAPGLHEAVSSAMTDEDVAAGERRAVEIYSEWALTHLAPPDENGRLANAMEDLISSNPDIVRVDQIAQRLAISTRTVQRLARRYIGVPPLAIIRRHRLQEAAQRLRDVPSISIAQVAAELGYADQAHLAADFRNVLGITARAYRTEG